MPSSTSFNIFMEKKKRRSSNAADDLATVKAAAWAWYQHGSGSEGKPMREFDATKAHFHHHHRHQTFKPSRYKLEAMKKIAECSAQRSSSSSPSSSWQMQSPVHTEDNSLLDAYEVERISNQLDYLLESSSSRLYSKYLDRDIYGQKSSNSTISSSSDIDYSTSSIRAMKKKNKKFLKGIWMRPTVVCGTRDDVDSRAFKGSQPRPPPVPGRHVPVVRMAICRRPRAAHV